MLLETYTALTGDELKNTLPHFLTIAKEVTGNPDYSMFNLSLREEWNSTNKYCHNLHGTVLMYLNPVTRMSIYISIFISYLFSLLCYVSVMTGVERFYFS